MYCFITTMPVAFYWARSDDTVHYRCDETVNFCGFRCATTSPITVFINLVFFTFILINDELLQPDLSVSQDKMTTYATSGKRFEICSNICLLTFDIILRCACSYENDVQTRGYVMWRCMRVCGCVLRESQLTLEISFIQLLRLACIHISWTHRNISRISMNINQ